MRTDKNLDHSIRENAAWEDAVSRTVALLDRNDAVTTSRIDGLRSSFSGHERNRLFINDRARAFHDLSGVSGLDSQLDGRVFINWDFNRDGWIDLGVINMNRPRVNLYRNELGLQGEPGKIIAVRFVGGNCSSQPQPAYSARDGYGAQVTLTAGDLELVREHRCGEGMAAQNSATMLIGIGDRNRADRIHVRWPSGREQEIRQVEAGTLITFHENPESAETPSGVVRAPYHRQQEPSDQLDSVEDPSEWTTLLRDLGTRDDPDPKIRVFTSMATWCPACKQALPQWKFLQAELGTEAFDLQAVPIDEHDDRQKLEAYVAEYAPTYQLLIDSPPESRRQFQQQLIKLVRGDALPSTIVTDENYRVLFATKSVPTLSQMKQAIASRMSRD